MRKKEFLLMLFAFISIMSFSQNNILVIDYNNSFSSDQSNNASNIYNRLVATQTSVTRVASVPAVISNVTYNQVWIFGDMGATTAANQNPVVTFMNNGGAVYVQSEVGCCNNQANYLDALINATVTAGSSITHSATKSSWYQAVSNGCTPMTVHGAAARPFPGTPAVNILFGANNTCGGAITTGDVIGVQFRNCDMISGQGALIGTGDFNIFPTSGTCTATGILGTPNNNTLIDFIANQFSSLLNCSTGGTATPTMTQPNNIVVCHGDPIPASNYTTNPTTATTNWTNSNTSIGLGASGTGNTPGFTANNTGTSPVTSTVTVTPVHNGCFGTPVTYTITVNPLVDSSWTNPSPLCASGGPINLNTLITGTTGGTWSGTGVVGNNFSPSFGSQSITYTVGWAPCQKSLTQTINVIPDVDSSWTNPSPICLASGIINLDSLVTGTLGGTWSGNGVTGNTFNPAAGSQSVTYTVGTPPCVETFTQTITVVSVDASWTNPSPICAVNGAINLDSLITGTLGGAWSGNGVTGNLFNPSVGTQNITYTIGTAPCQDTMTHTIIVYPDVDPSWTNPSPVCANYGLVDLNSLLTGTPGGTWSGPGVSGNYLNPSGLGNTNISLTYTVGTSPCAESQTQIINIHEVIAQINASPESGLSPLTVFFGNGSTGATNYFWDFNNGNTDTSFTSTQTFQSGTYNVLLIVNDGICWDTARVIIEVIDESSILIPNVFTPNDDGKNDVFKVTSINLNSLNVQIYDRWGLEMYSWEGVDGYWDGKAPSGKNSPDGTYYYLINAEGNDGKVYERKGAFTLIR